MTTIVEKTSDGIIYRAAETYPVPDLDILTLLFDSEHSLTKEDTPIHISAAEPSLVLPVSRARTLTHATSAALRNHYGIGRHDAGKDIVSGVVGAGGVFSAASAASTASELSKQIVGAGSKVFITCEATRDVAVRAAEKAGWGRNGGGRVLLMSEGAEWELRVVNEDGRLGANLIDESEALEWEKVTDPQVLKNRLVVLIYSSGTTGLPKDFEYRTIAHLPIAHIAGIQGYLINPFYGRHRITFFFTVPPIYLPIAKSALVTNQSPTHEHAIIGAAPLGKHPRQSASQTSTAPSRKPGD